MSNNSNKILVDKQLHQLVQEACRHPLGNLKRQQCLTQIIRLMGQSHQVWHEDSPYYEDALLQTWRYCGQNLDNAPPSTVAEGGLNSVLFWFNCSLKSHLRECARAWQQKTSQGLMANSQNPTPTRNNEVTTKSIGTQSNQKLLQSTRQWAMADPTGELKQVHLPNRPDINCQTLILRRLHPATSWAELAAELQLNTFQLSQFFQNQCMPRLSAFGREKYASEDLS